MKSAVLLRGCLGLLALLASTAGLASGMPRVVRRGAELVVKLSSDSAERRAQVKSIRSTARKHGALLQRVIAHRYAVIGLTTNAGADVSAQITTVDDSYLDFCTALKHKMNVLCEPNDLVRISTTPDDTYYSSLYGLRRANLPAAWNISTGSPAVMVAVVDTGVDYTHPDLSSNIAINSAEIDKNGVDDDGNGFIDDMYGYDFSNNDGDPLDDNSHGTHVSGTIGALGNNSYGVTGVNWAVNILPVKVLDASGSGSYADVAAGIDYAVARGASIINLSLGGSATSDVLSQSIAAANAAGVLVAAAAGNEGLDNDIFPSYPANFNLPNIISVAATNRSDKLASFSNYGKRSVDLSAPGVGILSTVPSGYASYSGTSMATPHVAGVAALIKAVNPALTVAQIKHILLTSVHKVAGLKRRCVSNGRLDASRALKKARASL